MKGREVIKVNKDMTLNELGEFMGRNWNPAAYGQYTIGRPTPASIEEYIMLPATENCLVILYPRKGKVILSVADNLKGAGRLAFSALPSDSTLLKIVQSSTVISRAAEMRGPANEIMLRYAEVLKNMLGQAGYL